MTPPDISEEAIHRATVALKMEASGLNAIAGELGRISIFMEQPARTKFAEKVGEHYTEAASLLTALRAKLTEVEAERDRMREALRAHTLYRHERPGPNGTFIPNGGSCGLCHREWQLGEPESHEAGCLSALPAGRKEG